MLRSLTKKLSCRRGLATRARVLYHYPCPDGVFAAAAAHFGLSNTDTIVKMNALKNYPSEGFIAHLISTIKPSERVFMVDITGTAALMKRVCTVAKEVIILDHHLTGVQLVDEMKAQGELPANLICNFDQSRSGAMISLDYFKENYNLKVSDDVQQLYDYIQDQDLWTHKFPETKAFTKGLNLKQLEFDFSANPSIFTTIYSLKASELIAEGRGALAADDALIAADLAKKFIVEFSDVIDGEPPVKFYGVITNSIGLRSEMGNQLSELSQRDGLTPMGMIASVSESESEPVRVSFRSIGDVDTTIYSRHFGGGGHKNASACSVSKLEFKKWKFS